MFFLAQSQTCHILIISVFCNGVIGLKVIGSFSQESMVCHTWSNRGDLFNGQVTLSWRPNDVAPTKLLIQSGTLLKFHQNEVNNF